ncbi:MAG: lauroyl acyltransferase [Octadecabacter sp.]
MTASKPRFGTVTVRKCTALAARGAGFYTLRYMRTLENATWADWAKNAVLRGVIRAALLMPYKMRVRAFGAFVERILAPLINYDKRAHKQLSFIWPDMPEDARTKLVKGVCNNFGRTMIENYSDAQFARQLKDAKIDGPGMDALEQANADGRPVLFVTGHFGNHEAPRRALAQQGYTIGGLYRPISNPYINAHYEKTMIEMSGPVFAQGRRGTMGFVRTLKEGGMGTLLFDIRANGSPRIPFMGQPAQTATSVADIALKIDALVLPYFGIRQPDGFSFEIAIETPIDHSTREQMMIDLTTRLEARINANPEQWFWVHKRWD